ncbi:superoxide dismutase [Candidatus Sumerlaeota bacterium]|nr:superoxide dismutase [Candidatus Sumerlaeota bacterium]
MMTTDRRQFLATGATAAVAGGAFLAAMPGVVRADEPAKGDTIAQRLRALVPGATNEQGEYALPSLPYGFDAVSEVIDAETMQIHHDKHHANYVKGLKDGEAALVKAHASGDYDQIGALSNKVAFNGGGHMLHCIFWDCIGPDNMGGEPKGSLAKQIETDFGGHKPFWAHFASAAKGVQGSGWAILAWSYGGNKLVIMQAQNQHLNTQWGIMPLLTLDVWEHAYYLKYKNDRGGYVDAFPKIINWGRIEKRFEILRG